MEPPGCAAHSEDCPACEADQTNLLPFTNNELGQTIQQTSDWKLLFLEQVQINQMHFCRFLTEMAFRCVVVGQDCNPWAVRLTVTHLSHSCFFISNVPDFCTVLHTFWCYNKPSQDVNFDVHGVRFNTWKIKAKEFWKTTSNVKLRVILMFWDTQRCQIWSWMSWNISRQILTAG